MVKRAGLMDTEAGTVRTPSLSGASSSAVTQAYVDLAQAADQVTKTFIKPMVDKETEGRALAAVQRGEFKTTDGVTAQDMIYDKIVDAGFMAKASTDVERIIGELENNRLGDLNVQAFNEELAEARNQYLEQLDSRRAVPLRQAWDERGLRSTQRLSGMATQKAIKDASESLKARLSLKVDQLSGVSDYGDPDAQQAIGEVEALHAAQIATGDKTQEEADAEMAQIFGRFTGNRVALEAVSLYEAGGFSEAAYSESMKMIETTLASTDLAMSRSERSAYEGAARQSLNAIRSERKAAERELEGRIREAQTRASTEFAVLMPDAKMRASQGYAPSQTEINELAQLARESGNPRLLAQVGQLAITSEMQQGMRGMSIPQQENLVAQIETMAAQGSADAARQLDAARSIAGASRRSAEADPASYAAVREGRDVPAIDFSTPDQAIATMRSRFQQAEIAADDLGVGVKYFSPAERTMLKAAADKGGTDALQAAQAIVEGATAAGVDPLNVLAEIGGSGAPLLATAGELLALGAPTDAAQKILSGRLAMGSELVKDKMPKQSVQASAQRRVLGGRLNNLPQPAVDALTRAADAHYASTLFENQGEAPGGETAAYEASMRAVLGEWKDESGKAWGGPAKMSRGMGSASTDVTVPPWIRQADFSTIVKSLPADVLSKAANVFPGSLGAYRGRPATAADFRSAALIDAGAGMYYVAPDPAHPEWLVQQAGNLSAPLVLNLNDIRETLKQRAPSAVK